MAWTYWGWIGCSVAISTFILVATIVVLVVILVECDSVFYGTLNQLLDIERCFMDQHHNIIRKDEKINFSSEMLLNLAREYGLSEFESEKNGSKDETKTRLSDHLTENRKWDNFSNVVPAANIISKMNRNSPSKTTVDKKEETLAKPQLNPREIREVLNIYGRYIHIHKRGARCFVVLLAAVIISGALIAAFHALFLSATSIYQGSPCLPIGQMECFCGPNNTNYTCNTGEINPCPLDVRVGACFRWTARDITTADVTSQLGITAGLLLALGKIAQGIIKLYLFAFNKRLSIATGIHRMAAKTIGINRHTASTRCLCCRLPCHCSPCNLSLFKHPCAIIWVTILYMIIPFLMFPGVALLYYYELSVTTLTFVVLAVLAVVCVVSIVWIMVQENEALSNIPGGWSPMKVMKSVINAKAIGVSAAKI